MTAFLWQILQFTVSSSFNVVWRLWTVMRFFFYTPLIYRFYLEFTKGLLCCLEQSIAPYLKEKCMLLKVICRVAPLFGF